MARPDFRGTAARRLSEERELSPSEDLAQAAMQRGSLVTVPSDGDDGTAAAALASQDRRRRRFVLTRMSEPRAEVDSEGPLMNPERSGQSSQLA